jgi:hypothetical protein
MEGRNFFLVPGSFHPRTTIPGTCKECGETFVIHVTEDPKTEGPLRALAMAIYQGTQSWDSKNLNVVGEAREYIRIVLQGVPGMHSVSPEPAFKIHRNASGNLEILPTNNTALRTMEILDEIRKRNVGAKSMDIDDLQGV